MTPHHGSPLWFLALVPSLLSLVATYRWCGADYTRSRAILSLVGITIACWFVTFVIAIIVDGLGYRADGAPILALGLAGSFAASCWAYVASNLNRRAARERENRSAGRPKGKDKVIINSIAWAFAFVTFALIATQHRIPDTLWLHLGLGWFGLFVILFIVAMIYKRKRRQ